MHYLPHFEVVITQCAPLHPLALLFLLMLLMLHCHPPSHSSACPPPPCIHSRGPPLGLCCVAQSKMLPVYPPTPPPHTQPPTHTHTTHLILPLSLIPLALAFPTACLSMHPSQNTHTHTHTQTHTCPHTHAHTSSVLPQWGLLYISSKLNFARSPFFAHGHPSA